VALSIALFPCIKILIASSPAQFSDASVDLPQTTERTLKLMFSQKNQIESNSAILRYINADSAGTVLGGRQPYLPRFMAGGASGTRFFRCIIDRCGACNLTLPNAPSKRLHVNARA
jgi:hypothetical protein